MRWKIIIIIFVVAICVVAVKFLLYLNSPVALVNDKAISRVAFNNGLEQSIGNQTLENMVAYILLEQQAQKKHIVVSQQEVTREMQKEEAGLLLGKRPLKDFLSSHGESLNQFTFEAQQNVLLRKVFGNRILANNQEVQAYLIANSNNFANWPKEAKEDAARHNLQMQKIQSAITDLKAHAFILYFITYPGTTQPLFAHIL